ncbi:DUF7573 domain-containing protein [Halorubrum sp. DTA98]|uniref:DUF7573 domain-containing protein n=1 Tax=Halorubrum sp. DTA98 TaxID=3402163 RepID=UPI003AB034F0
MPEDRSLDEFAGVGSDEADDGVTDVEEEDVEGADVEGADVEVGADADGPDPGTGDSTASMGTDPDTNAAPAVSTSSWTTDGDACDRCGDAVERRWREGESFVCIDCKDW